MNWKRLVGLFIIACGIGLYFYCNHGKERMIAARHKIDSVDGIIPRNPVTDPITDPIRGAVKQDLYRRVDKHKEPIRLCFIGSGILVFGGLLLIIFGKNSKKKRK